jgi:hypothetical protein
MKPFIVVRQLGQALYLGGVMGFRRLGQAFDYVGAHPEYTENLIKDGTLGTEQLGIKSQILGYSKFSDWALGPVKRSDLQTRAIAAHTAETGFNEGLAMLREGKIKTPAEFFQESGFAMLPQADRQAIWSALMAQDTTAALKIAQRQVVRLTMFEAATSETGNFFKSSLGRFMGKFGQFPVAAVDMYRMMAKNVKENPLGTASFFGRMIAASAATYYAFRQVGIDYTGFLFSDPFTYGGGPGIDMVQNVTDTIGAADNLLQGNTSGQEWQAIGAVAGYAGLKVNSEKQKYFWGPDGPTQHSVSLDPLRSPFLPLGSYGRSLAKIQGAVDGGASWGTLLALGMGAPMRRDLNWLDHTQMFWDGKKPKSFW